MTSSLKLFLILHYIKQIDSKLPCVCSVIDHRGHQNVVRTLVTHSAAPRVPLFCSYHILTSSVIYYWTEAWQLGIYLVIYTFWLVVWIKLSLPFDLYKRQACNYSYLQFHCWITPWGHKNNKNDHLVKRLWIIKQILSITTLVIT